MPEFTPLRSDWRFSEYMPRDEGIAAIRELFNATTPGKWYWTNHGLVRGAFYMETVFDPKNTTPPERELDGTRETAVKYWQARLGSRGEDVQMRTPENATFLGEAHGMVEYLLKQIDAMKTDIEFLNKRLDIAMERRP